MSKELKINYSSAKSILKVYRDEKRFQKVLPSQRYCYVKGAVVQEQLEENKELLNLGEKLKQKSNKANSHNCNCKDKFEIKREEEEDDNFKAKENDKRLIHLETHREPSDRSIQSEELRQKVCKIRFLSKESSVRTQSFEKNTEGDFQETALNVIKRSQSVYSQSSENTFSLFARYLVDHHSSWNQQIPSVITSNIFNSRPREPPYSGSFQMHPFVINSSFFLPLQNNLFLKPIG